MLKRLRNPDFVRLFVTFIAIEAITLTVGWFLLTWGVQNWIHVKGLQLTRIANEVASAGNWPDVENVKPGSKIDPSLYKKYRAIILKFNNKYNVSASIFKIDRGEDYDLITEDPDPTIDHYGKATSIEMEVYATQKADYTPIPHTDADGTYLTGYAPIIANNKVIALVDVGIDSSSIQDLKAIVQATFWRSIGPAFLLSITAAFFLVGYYAEPFKVLRELHQKASSDTGQTEDSRDERWEKLTEKEKETAIYLSYGLENSEIAEKMHVSIETVKKHLSNAYQKLELKNRTSLGVIADRHSPVSAHQLQRSPNE